MRIGKKYNKIQILTGIILLLCFGLMGGLMAGSGSKNLRDFWDNGKVYQMEVKDAKDMTLQGIEMKNGKMYVINQDAKISLRRARKSIQYYYIYVNVAELNQDFMFVKFAYYNMDGVRIASQLDAVRNGDNTLTIPVAGEIAQVKMFIPTQEGVEFILNKVEMRDRIAGFSKKRALAGAMAGGMFCILLCGMAAALVQRKRVQESIQRVKTVFVQLLYLLQKFYRLQEYPARWLSGRMSFVQGQKIRVGFFAIICAYSVYVQHFGSLGDPDDFKYYLLLFGAMLIFVAWTLYEGKLELCRWENNPVAVCWFLYWICVCIADALMGSEYHLLGYWMIVIMGTLFFFWANQSKRETLLKEMVCGICIGIILYILAAEIRFLYTGTLKELIHVPGIEELKIAWKCYFTELNLIGHSQQPNSAGRQVYAYNGFLELVYRYGIFILLPYSILLYSMWTEGKKMLVHRERKMQTVEKILLGIEIVFAVALFTTNVEIPFLSPIWILFYLHIGYFFRKT